MGTIRRLVPKVRREAESDFASHAADVYILGFEAEDRAIAPVTIYATSPTPSHFNSYDDGTVVPNGSLLIDIADSGKMWLKQGATTWTEIGDVT
jgi:hypothetical protein